MRIAGVFLLLAAHATGQDISITYLANEAYLVDDGKRAVLVDAFVPESYHDYEPLRPATWQAMRDGRPPFDRVVAAVVSHHHRDHFQADAAARFLAAHPDVTLFGPPGLAAPLREADYGGDRFVSVLPGYGSTHREAIDGVELEFLRLRHRSSKDAEDVENLGVVIAMSGRRVLHVGDAYPERANFEPFALPRKRLDLAIIPDWYFATEWFPGGPSLVEELVAARCVLVTHVPVTDRAAKLAKLHAAFPDLALLAERGGALNVAGCGK